MPSGVLVPAALSGLAPGFEHGRWNFKRAMRPLQHLTRSLGVFSKQATTVAAALTLQAGNAFGDDGAASQQRRPWIGTRGIQCAGNGLDVMPIHLDHMPACHTKTLSHVFTDRQRSAAVVSDLVVVP